MRLPSLRAIVHGVAIVVVTGAGVLFARSQVLDRTSQLFQDSPVAVSTPTAAIQQLTSVGTRVYQRVVRRATSEPVRRPIAAFAQSVVPRRERNGCWSVDPTAKVLTLHVYRGMTLSDLAEHFTTTVAQLRHSNPRLRDSILLAGQAYKVPIGHLRTIHHRVAVGDTMNELRRAVHAPTAYSIRTWNCLDTSRLRAGDTVLLFSIGATHALAGS